MNKTALYVIIGIILLAGSAVAYVLSSPVDDTPTNETVITSDDQSSAETSPDKTTDQPGKYTDYSEEAILATTGTKLLFFHAPWCPQCLQIETSIEQDGVPDNVTVLKVDYDSNQALRQKYGVTLQTTFVKIDDQGNKINSYTAYEEPNFDAVKRELLQ